MARLAMAATVAEEVDLVGMTAVVAEEVDLVGLAVATVGMGKRSMPRAGSPLP